ncbi:MAG: sugar phosphate nucleotidyltransferase, partial [Bacteroidota bacterium]|nr:sugar phosphate nucleotidyltransferase [Bacteroidota bacterium]
MQAMIFAAGLGTRLKYLTNDIPKALVSYKGKPLLQITIENLKAQGVDDIIINVHHFAQKVKDFLTENNNFNTKITISDETNKLLETGGGLFFASKLFNNAPFLVHNVDIISSIDLKKMYN